MLPSCFAFVVESQVRQGLAQMGLRSLDELVGRADYLQQRDAPLAKTGGLDLSFLTTYAGGQAYLAVVMEPIACFSNSQPLQCYHASSSLDASHGMAGS